MIVKFEEKYIDQIVYLWNKNVFKKTIFKEMSKEIFETKFLKNEYFDKNLFLLKVIDGNVIGYGHAVCREKGEDTPSYITMIVVDEAYQRQGIGKEILQTLESKLKQDFNKKYIRQIYQSPINFEWIIPNKEAYHPGAPAVPFNSPFYFFLLNNGFIINGQQQDAYFQDIRDYERPIKVITNNKRNENDGYFITFYDDKLHYGFEELFKALNSTTWAQAVKHNLSKEKPNPMLVIVKENRILGWTGPLYTEASKRGYFAGIGVHPECQGRGLGKSLFSELVYQSKINGAHYMTLFTGAENPARNIYLDAGFKIQQSFAILRKDI